MKKITLPDFEKNHVKKSSRRPGWFVICMLMLFAPLTIMYGQVIGSTCNNPLVVVALPFSATGNTSTYGNNYSPNDVPPIAPTAVNTASSSGSNYYLGGFEVVYSITPLINGQINISTTNSDDWVSLWVFTGCSFSSTVGLHTTTSGTSRTISSLPVTANTTYYIVISNWNEPGVNYTLNVNGTAGLLAPLEACTGTPVGGTSSLSSNNGNAGASIIANATGVTGASGLSYQWQKSVAGTWVDIAGATTINSTFTADAGAVGTVIDYQLKVTCTASGESSYSSIISYTISLTYCVPTGSGNNGDEIINFTLSNLNNTSTPSDGVLGYKNYSGTVAAAQLSLEVPYSPSITSGVGSGNHGAAIWIDYNQNGTFESNEKVSFITSSIGASTTANFPEFIVPAGTPLGTYRLRVQYHYSKSGDLLDPCTITSTFAETEDYNIQVMPVPTCIQPSGLTTLNVTDTSADLSWTSSGSSFVVEWGVDNFAPGSGTTVTSTSSTYALSGLTANTKYSFYVRQNCGTTDGLSLWTGPYKFKTACGSLTSFFENFDTSVTGTTAPMPSCWERAGNGSTYITTGSVAPNSPANRLYMSANGSLTTPTQGFAIMPAVSNLQASTHRLKFKAYASTLNKSMEIGYFTTLTDLSSFVLIESITLPGTAAANTEEFTVEPTGIPAGVTNLVFRNNAPGNSVTVYIDDVAWEPLPLCPDITLIEADAISSASATITFEPGDSEIAWEYVYGPAASTTSPTGLTPVAVNNNPMFDLTGLTGNTAYNVWIRSTCEAGQGNWPQAPFKFTTLCNAVTEFTENFDSYTLVGSANPLPNCWSRFGSTGFSYITTGSTAPMSPSNRLYLSANTTTSLDAIAIMPPVSNLQAGTHRLRFKAFSTTAEKSLELGYFDYPGDPESFVVVEAFELPGTTIATAIDFNYTPEFIPDGVESLAFRNHGPAFSGTTTIYIDDVAWEPLPACFDITEITFANIGATTVDVEFNPGGSETAWQYVYALSTVTSPEGLTPIVVENNPYISISGLESSTSYNIWIRSNCGGGSFGNWSTVQLFTTACAPVTDLPWMEGFESVTTVGTASFPSCWLKENGDWSTALVSSYNTPKSGTKYLRVNWSAINDTMWTPGFELTAGTSYDFSFFMQGDGFAGWDVALLQSTQQDAENSTQIGETVTAVGSGPIALQQYQLVSNTFTVDADGVYYFALRVNQPSGSPWYVAFDDFKMEVTPSCVAPTIQQTTNVTSTSATISWSTPDVPSNGYEYFITTDANDLPNTTTIPTGSVAGTVTEVNLTSLVSSTVHYVYVKALCGTGDISTWSSAGTFTTACGEVETFTQNFDSSPTGSANPLPLCWERAGTGSTYVTSGGAAPGSAPNRLYMFASGTTPTQSIAIMPVVSNLQANTHRLKFSAYASIAGRTLEIGYFTDSSDLTTFNLLETVTLPGTSAATAQTFTFNPSNIPAGINQLAFRNIGIATSSTTAYIDDVIWEAKPTIAPTCATSVTAIPNASCGNFATVLTWNANAATDGYYLNVGTTAGAVDVLNNEDIGLVTTYSFIATYGTTYFYTLIPYNNAGAATGCTEQTFTTAANGCYCASVPTSNDNSGITNVQVGTQNFPNGDVMYFDHTATVVDLAQAVNSNLQVTFGTGYTYGTNVWIDLNDNFNFEEDELVFSGESTNANPTTLNASFLMPLNAPLGNHRMRIVATDVVQVPANPCYNGSYGVTLDFKINVTGAPTCLAPTELAIDPATLSGNGVFLIWNAATTNATEGYDYYYSTSSTLPTASTTPSGSVAAGVTTVALTGLTSVTPYYAWVRSKCSTSETSMWSNSVSFTTPCSNYDAPFTEDFSTFLPNCWSRSSAGTLETGPTNTANGIWAADGFLNNTTTGSARANLYSSGRIGWLITPVINTVVGQQHAFTFNYGITSYSGTTLVAMGSDDFVKIVMSTDNGVTWTEIENFTAASNVTNTSQDYEYLFTATSAEVKFAFIASDGIVDDLEDYNFYVDNVIVMNLLSNTDFENKSFTVYPNPVKDILNIRYNETISDVTVFNLLGQQLFVRNINATEGKVDMANLSSGTYLVKITSGEKAQTIKVIKE